MATEFFPQLSQNFINILDDKEHYDITIEVGQGSEVELFRAHMIILKYRSAYFRKNLSASKNDIKLPNISPKIFQLILIYIYGGILILDEIKPLDIINLLVAAESLNLQEIVNFLQSYFIKNKYDWVKENSALIHDAIFQHDSFTELQKVCTDIMLKDPEKINFTSMREKSLISLIKRDDLKMEEVNIWENVLLWGIAQNPNIVPGTWSDDDFEAMKNTLQNCLPFIRFSQLTSEEFFKSIRPYKKLLDPQLYEGLMNYYLANDDTMITLSKPRNFGNIDSKLITSTIAAYIASWIDKREREHPVHRFDPYKPSNNPYKFELLLRGSRDEFDTETFHKLCDDKPKTVSIIKVKETNEILGGYNPLTWEVKNDRNSPKSSDSFIFSFTSMKLDDVVLSRINSDKPVLPSKRHGPYFGNDLYIKSDASGYCSKSNYAASIRKQVDFYLDEYEVFQIVKKDINE